MAVAPALQAEADALPLGHDINRAYQLLLAHKLPACESIPKFQHLSADARRRLRLGHRSGWTCTICLEPCSLGSGTIDHHVPLAQGGSDAPENLRWTHKSCNHAKANRMPTSGVIAACFRPNAQHRFAAWLAAQTVNSERETELDAALAAAAPPQVPTVPRFEVELRLQLTVAADGSASVSAPLIHSAVAG